MNETGHDAFVSWTKRTPEGWAVKRLKYAVRLISEKIEPGASGLRYIGLEHVESWTGRLIETTEGEGSADGLATRFRPNDVLFGKLRPYLAKVHRAKQDGVCSGELLVLRPTLLDSRYLNYFLLMNDFIGAVDASTYGSKMPRANWGFIGNLPTLVPSLDEQRTIAAFLDRETAKVDALIGKNRELTDLLAEQRFSTIHDLVMKGIGTSQLNESGHEWIGSIPTHWSVVKTKFAARLATGHTPSREHPEYWVNCDIPWFSLADVWQLRSGRQEYLGDTSEKVSQLGLANSAAVLLPAGTVIVSRTASVGFSGIMPVPMATTQDFVNWVCGPKIRPEYLLYVFRSMRNEFQRLTMGSTHKTIYMPDVADFVTPLPPVDEQDSIVRAIRQKTAVLDRLTDALVSECDRLIEYRSALISAAVTGQIDVRNYHPQEAAALCQ
jgi:type I restriction enzyme, S subunit